MALDSLDFITRYLVTGLIVCNTYLICSPQMRDVKGDRPTAQDCFDCILLWPTVLWYSIEGSIRYVYDKLVDRNKGKQ